MPHQRAWARSVGTPPLEHGCHATAPRDRPGCSTSLRFQRMVRGSLITLVAAFVIVGVLASGAGATSGVEATLTRAVEPGPPGTHVAVAWKLRDRSGHAVLDKHVYVKITCPEGDRSTVTYANPNHDGVYVVSAIVPPGGVGSITVGQGRSTYPLTNPYHG